MEVVVPQYTNGGLVRSVRNCRLSFDIPRFVVKDMLVPRRDPFPLNDIGKNVKNFCFGQVIPACTGVKRYNAHELSRLSNDDEILKFFSCPILIRMNIVWELMRLQPTPDSSGLLLNDGRSNVFYVPTGKSTDSYCTVGVYYKLKAWNIHAYQTLQGSQSRKWFGGNQIILPATSL